MLNSTTWLYGAEVLPIALRSKVMGLAASSHFIVNVASKWHSLNDQGIDSLILSQSLRLGLVLSPIFTKTITTSSWHVLHSS